MEITKQGLSYLEEIFEGKWHIHNPTDLDIEGLGKFVATSMVLTRFRQNPDKSEDNQRVRYFSFQMGEKSGEIVEQGRKYFLEYQFWEEREELIAK
ncbi:Uncharacterised protein [uncultured archaeon]|nr:Uncharacterised protein [uncultured archaeon]